MNMIEHVSCFYAKHTAEKQLKPSHICLYMAILHRCNYNCDKATAISARPLMRLSGIRKKYVFNKCLRELHQWGYAVYHAPRHKGGLIRTSLIAYPCTDEQYDQFGEKDQQIATRPPAQKTIITGKMVGMGNLLINIDALRAQAAVSPSWDELLTFFIHRGLPAKEAARFYSYYESKSSLSVNDWKSVAEKWCIRHSIPGLHIAASACIVNPLLQ